VDLDEGPVPAREPDIAGQAQDAFGRVASREVVEDGGEVKGSLAGARLLAIVAALSAAPAQAQSTLDPQGSGVIVSAVNWLQGTLLGTVATVVAVIAVASVGFMMLTGRINWRYGAVVILGCFILFGAASIVAGIRSAATLGG
jgi:type IV secretion system protein VirB2